MAQITQVVIHSPPLTVQPCFMVGNSSTWSLSPSTCSPSPPSFQKLRSWQTSLSQIPIWINMNTLTRRTFVAGSSSPAGINSYWGIRVKMWQIQIGKWASQNLQTFCKTCFPLILESNSFSSSPIRLTTIVKNQIDDNINRDKTNQWKQW